MIITLPDHGDLCIRFVNLFVVLGTQGRMFKSIFDQAQRELREIFGMQLVELPMREKTKLSQRRGIINQCHFPPSTSR